MIEFCLRILADDLPGNASLHWPPAVDARGSLSAWLGLVLFVGMVVLAWWLYRRENALLGRNRRVSLALLPTLAGGSIILLAMRVIVTAEFHAEQERSVVLLIDNSQSMKQRDRRDNEAERARVGVVMGTSKSEPNGVAPSRLEMASQVLMNPTLDLLGGLKKHGPVKPYLFGDKLRGVPENELPTALQGNDPRTALADAIQEILSGKDGELPAALVVITDGGDNASKISLEEAGRRCASAKVPLHVYGVGVAGAGSLQIKDVGLPEVIFFDDIVKVPVRWSSHGFRQGQVRMALSVAGKTLVQRDIPVREGDDLREELQFTPTRTAGEREEKADCVVTIEHLQDRHYRDTLAAKTFESVSTPRAIPCAGVDRRALGDEPRCRARHRMFGRLADRSFAGNPHWLRYGMTAGQLALAVGLGLWLSMPLFRRLNDNRLALVVEDREGDLQHVLIAAVQLSESGARTDGMSPELIALVVTQAEEQTRDIDFARFADHRRLKWALALFVPVILSVAVTGASWLELIQALLQRQALVK